MAAPKIVATNLTAAAGTHAAAGTSAFAATSTATPTVAQQWAALVSGHSTGSATVHVNPTTGEALHPWLQHLLNGTGGHVVLNP